MIISWLKSLKAVVLEHYEWKLYLQQWRAANQHNSVEPVDYVDLQLVTIGRKSYGPIKISSYGAGNEQLTIGNYVSMAPGTHFLLGGEHPYTSLSTYPAKVMLKGDKYEAISRGPIVVKDDVWIGTDSLVFSGVTIGQGAIIAARSVVTKDVPPYSIVGGNPAKIIKYRFDEKLIEKLISVDFGELCDQVIVKKIDMFYEEINLENIDEKIAHFFGESDL